MKTFDPFLNSLLANSYGLAAVSTFLLAKLSGLVALVPIFARSGYAVGVLCVQFICIVGTVVLGVLWQRDQSRRNSLDNET